MARHITAGHRRRKPQILCDVSRLRAIQGGTGSTDGGDQQQEANDREQYCPGKHDPAGPPEPGYGPCGEAHNTCPRGERAQGSPCSATESVDPRRRQPDARSGPHSFSSGAFGRSGNGCIGHCGYDSDNTEIHAPGADLLPSAGFYNRNSIGEVDASLAGAVHEIRIHLRLPDPLAHGRGPRQSGSKFSSAPAGPHHFRPVRSAHAVQLLRHR